MFAAIMIMSALSVAGVAQDQAHRGAMVMGFDQQYTVHHFRLYPDGGAIEVEVREDSDVKDRNAIRAHLPHIAMMFSEGDFDAPMLVHDSANVSGTKAMAEKKYAIHYRYEDTPAGGRVSIATTDPDALAAIHDFLRYQIVEHKTGDSMIPQTR